MYPKAGLFASKKEKRFVRGVTAYMQGLHKEALTFFEDVIGRDHAREHVSEEFFAALCQLALGGLEKAKKLLEEVVASVQEIPDPLMQKYGISGEVEFSVTPALAVRVAISNVSAALLLAELYQRTEEGKRAIELLESLGDTAPEPVFALSLAELYLQDGRLEDVLRVTDDFDSNVDDVTTQLLTLRAQALMERGLNEAALAVLKEALRYRRRSPILLRAARYVRARTYEEMGRKGQARKELERIYGEDAHFADVAERMEAL